MPTYTPRMVVIRLDTAAMPRMASWSPGYAAMMLAEDAAIMEPDPTPAPIARASGSKIFQLATSEDVRVLPADHH